MRISKFITTLLIPFALTTVTKAQTVGDLSRAPVIDVNKTYTFANSPEGPGARQEFPVNQSRSPALFKEERNTAWFLLPIPYAGTLTFEISPKSKKDDYDWMLFRYSPALERDIARNMASPLRSNISRNDPSAESKTGLRKGYQNLFAVAGPGKSYSKPLTVKKGDTLALVIDNIYEGGEGFTFTSKLELEIPMQGMLSGRMFSSEKKPLTGEIICEDDSTGVQVSRAITDASGRYSIEVPTHRPLNLVAKASSYLYQTADLTLTRPSDTLDFYLDPIRGGAKLILFNIHFSPDRDLILYSAAGDLSRLITLLKDNPNYNARIVGHTHNNPFASAKYLQKLSFNRALAVKKQLLANGITEDRLSCAGMGGKTPFVNSNNPEEALKNLRVEVILEQR